MDLILLAGEPGEPAAQSERAITGTEGGRCLEDFLGWQREGGASPDLYAVMPPQEDIEEELLELLGGHLGELADQIYALIPPSRLSRRLLERLEAIGPLHLILTTAAGEEPVEHGLGALADHLADHPDSNLYLGVWLELGGTVVSTVANYRCVRSLLTAGVPAELIDLPGFALEPGGDDRGTGPSAAPAAFLTGLYFCQLYRHAITVDRWGRVRTCPRAVGGGAMLPLGNIFDDDPETLLSRKGEASHRISTMELCIGCRQHGQFSWPDRLSERAVEIFHDGLRRGPAVLRPAVAHSQIRQFNLAVESPDGRRRAIKDFASRLRSWSEDMERWERQRGSGR